MADLKTFDHFSNIGAEDKQAVIALGNFDGLHRGHQAVISKAKTIAQDLGAPLGVGLFSPHPFRFFKPDADPFRLMSAALRADLLQKLEVERLYKIPFDHGLRGMDDTEFVDEVLHKGLGIRHVVVGEDFGFGKNRCGNIESLTRLCAARGIGVTALPPVGLHAIYGKYGSTHIREALRLGDVMHAAHMLSRPWIVDGIVRQGEQRGRTIGFPTANIELGDLIRPKFGVYCTEVKLPGEDVWRPSIANIGRRPTVNGAQERLEVHLFNFNQDIYGQHVQVALRSFIREEKKFENFDALKDQIVKDAMGAKAVFGLLD